MKKIWILSLLASIFSEQVTAQHSSNAYLSLADSLYRHHHYQDAAVYYQKSIKKSAQPGNMMLWVAKSYAKTNAITDAEVWFSKAKTNKASFSVEDIYLYAQVLLMQQKRKDAEVILQELLNDDPNALMAHQMLEDVRDYKKYYRDSSGYDVISLSLNTPVSEFAPAYYKDGIVFTSATQEGFSRKKYHWDNSHFLNLYYTSKSDASGFKKPVLFEKQLSTRFHDGPAIFYNDNGRMIVNRNQPLKSTGKEDTWIWHLSLFDAVYDNNKSEWQVSALPFDEPPYSFAHPWISEHGNVLFFVSDKPGGYGGTDIYRSVKTNGVWGKAFNLGPAVNTPENEVFPYFVNNTLYFGSNGHGGLGGLDIFKTNHTLNGFTPPVNLGSPINSPADDFSFITKGELHSGYFASARNGNDDLFSFRKKTDIIHLAGHIYDAGSNSSLPNANIQVITLTGEDIHVTSNVQGDFRFDLPIETAFVLIGSKDGKVGMVTGSAEPDEDKKHKIHQVALIGDTSRIACIGMIRNELGASQRASGITIVDETTGKRVDPGKENSMISFLAEKNHTYRVEIKNEDGEITTHNLSISPDETGSRTWTMTLKEPEKMMTLAAFIFNEADKQPLGNADVKIITFDQPDQELVANAEGVVEFQLIRGTAYIVIGSKNDLTGMHSGIADKGSEKASVVHPVPAHGDPPPKDVPVVALVTNKNGEILLEADAVVTNKATGETIPVKVEEGVLSFIAERGKDYNISVSHNNHQTTLEEVSIPSTGLDVEKIAVVLEEKPPVTYQLAARVFKAMDQSPLAGADVRIISFTEPDAELVASADGTVDFSLPEGTAYMVVGSKDGFVGMHSGIVEKGSEKASVIHSVPANAEPEKQLPVVGLISNKQGDVLKDAMITVIEKSSGKEITAQVKEGVVSFPGEKGKDYTITVGHDDHHTETESINIPVQATDVQKFSIVMNQKKDLTPSRLMAVRVFKVTDNTPLAGAQVKIISFTEPDIELTANDLGIADFKLPDGTAYMVVGSKDGFIGMHSGTAEKGTDKAEVTHPVPASSEPEKQIPVVGRIVDNEGNGLNDATVTVSESATGKKMISEFREGMFSFQGEKGREYDVVVEYKDHHTEKKSIHIPALANDVQKLLITLEQKPVAPASWIMSARVFKAKDQSPLAAASVKIISFTEPDLDLTANQDGTVDFTLPDGTAYMVVGSKDGFIGMHSGIAEKGMDRTIVVHPVPAHDEPATELPVIGRISGKEGTALENATVVVTEKNTGTVVQSGYKDGLLSFAGEKGKEYSIAVDHDDHHTLNKDILVPGDATTVQKVLLELNRRSGPVSWPMAARVFNASENTALGGAQVRIISFTEPDLDLVADTNGIVDFTLPDGTAYMVVGSKDGFIGMHSGIAEKGMEKLSVVHPVPATRETEKELPVIGHITDAQGDRITDAVVTVKEKSSGRKIDSQFSEGLLSFMGEKGKDYSITADHNDHRSVTQNISVPDQSTGIQKISVALKERKQSKGTVVVLNTDRGMVKAFINSSGGMGEITERDGILYEKQGNNSRALGNGTLARLKSDPKSLVEIIGLQDYDIIELRTIYFDLNKALLDDEDKRELSKVNDVLENYPDLKLIVSAHADVRGQDEYNLNLSKKRAKAVGAYLRKLGADKDRISTKAFGESTPAGPCAAENCSEEEHQKNRRAEFVIGTENENPPAAAKNILPAGQLNYSQVLERYGEKEVEGVRFRIVVGAYRYNTTMTFKELQDLGTIESVQENGITFYYLTGFSTLRSAEEIRAQIIEREIRDAWIAIFYQGEKISLSKFLSIAR